jgi:hypothetical protein
MQNLIEVLNIDLSEQNSLLLEKLFQLEGEQTAYDPIIELLMEEFQPTE